jgi:shikimate dehydrogenase
MVRSITKDTTLCMSLAGRPSNVGTRFHNFLYAELDLDFVYKAFTTTDLAAAIAGIRALGIRGCGISMPYKEACVEHVDELDGSAEAIGSVNTIVNTGGRLRAYNTDYLAVAKLLADRQVPADRTFAVLGSGGMAKAVVAALRDVGFHAGTVVARNPGTGAALAERYGYVWRAEVGAGRPQLLVNATPVGMSGGPAADDLPVAPEVVDAAETILDVVAVPALTSLVRRARAQGKQVITGAEVIALQAVEQFVLSPASAPATTRSVAPRSSPAHSPTPKWTHRRPVGRPRSADPCCAAHRGEFETVTVQDASAVAFGWPGRTQPVPRRPWRRRVRWNCDAAPAWPCPPAWWVGRCLATRPRAVTPRERPEGAPTGGDRHRARLGDRQGPPLHVLAQAQRRPSVHPSDLRLALPGLPYPRSAVLQPRRPAVFGARHRAAGGGAGPAVAGQGDDEGRHRP